LDFREAIDRFAIANLRPEDIPDIAVQALEDGYDSPSLRRLAVAQGDYHLDIEDRFLKVLAELKIPLPLPGEAAMSIARRVAANVINGTVEPIEGARELEKLWFAVYKHEQQYPELGELATFSGLVDVYDSVDTYEESESRKAEAREDYLRQTMDAFRRILSG